MQGVKQQVAPFKALESGAGVWEGERVSTSASETRHFHQRPSIRNGFWVGGSCRVALASFFRKSA